MESMIFGAASAFTFALVSVLDKLLISDHVPNSKVFIVYVGFAQILLGISVLPVAINSDFPVNGIVIATLSGILSGMYLVLMFTIMASQDVSRVVPVVSTYPIFVAILAFFFLNENVTILTMLGILVTVVGAALVSLGPAKNGAESERSDIKALLLLVAASLFFGLSQFVTKIIADDMTIWGQFLLRGVGGGIVCMSLIILPGGYKGVLKVGKNPRSPCTYRRYRRILGIFRDIILLPCCLLWGGLSSFYSHGNQTTIRVYIGYVSKYPDPETSK